MASPRNKPRLQRPTPDIVAGGLIASDPGAKAAAIEARERHEVALSELTTIRLGGPARRLLEARTEEEAVWALTAADLAGERILMLGGGSNVVIADAGVDATVLRMLTRGATTRGRGGRVNLDVSAGEPWDDVVARCVAEGLAGIECLSGIPGLAGATPVQNVGAYGQQVADTIHSVRAYDRRTEQVVELTAAACRFGYRTSRLRAGNRFVVLGVRFELERSPLARPLRYPALAHALGARLGERPPLVEVREAVLALRRGRGMVTDPHDPDSVSVGSFFLNPILPAQRFAAIELRAIAQAGTIPPPPSWPQADGRIKTSAAWLVERAGFPRGFGDGPIGLSTKHPLALVNRGGASTAQLLTFAREIRHRVRESFGVTLQPEPTLVGVAL